MRSHAKASSVGSNPGRGASRRSLRCPGTLAALFVALMAAACLLPGSAFAVEIRTVTESFGPDGTSGTSFAFPGTLGFDQGSKRLYALGGEEKIYAFDSSTPGTHTPLTGNFPLSVPVGEFNGIAANDTSHDFYYADPSDNELHGFNESGAVLSGFPIGGQNYSCGTAVDSAGNVWVSEGNEGKVKKYSPAGALLETIAIGGEPCSLAFDSTDNLYVGFFFGPTKKFTASSSYTNSTTVDAEFTSAMTVDRSTDEVYVIHYNYIDVWSNTGEFLYELKGEGFGGEFAGIAIDEATEELYVSDYGNHKIQVFGAPTSVPKLTTEPASAITATTATANGTINPKEQTVEGCHFEVVPAKQFIQSGYTNVTAAQEEPCVPAAGSIPADSEPHAVSAGLSGLNPASVYHYRLVAINAIGEAQSTDRAFTTGAVAPLVQEPSVEAVGTGDATVAAKVSPQGAETTYHLEYGTTEAYGQGTAESVPFGFPSDNVPHTVSVHIGGLQPGTAYHFRFVATNSAGSTLGPDASFATYPTNLSFGSCPDERFRIGAAARLPDCRAYEQASPIEKHGSNAQGRIGEVNASDSGDRVTFFANGGLPVSGGNSSLVSFLASRGPDGWSTDGVLPPTPPGAIAEIYGRTHDLVTTLVGGPRPGGVGWGFYLRDSDTGTFHLSLAVPNGVQPSFGGFAADASHYIFATHTQLLPSAPVGKYNLYEVNHGDLTLADRIPAGSALSCDDEAGPACVVPPQGLPVGNSTKVISRDGSRVFFAVTSSGAPEGSGRIYMREDGARTTWIAASQRTAPDPNGEKPATFQSVTPDGSKVFFTSCEKLTDDSTAVSTGENRCAPVVGDSEQGEDLYSYDVETGQLTDLTVDSNASDPKGAGVQGIVGTSADGSYVYFVANGVLAPGASLGNCRDVFGDCSLYVFHNGVTKFIARMQAENDSGAWGGPDSRGGAQITPDGSVVLFGSVNSLTGYNNAGPCGNGGDIIACREFFRYSAADGELLCVTCNPTGVTPGGRARLGTPTEFLSKPSGGFNDRNLSADGNRVFFESPDPLIAADTNGNGHCQLSGAEEIPACEDVYEWEAKGTGSCESEGQNGGCIYLISSGTSPEPAQFLDASANGDHVFFFTVQQLVPSDKDALFDVYDAGVGAGLASQHTLAPPTCSSTACQANPAPPPDPTTSSAAFSGPGNAHKKSAAHSCPKGKRKVRRAGKVRCQRAPRHHKQHKRHNNRGGAK